MDILLGFVLTLMVFSYVLGDNLLYRLAVYIFVGTAAAFTTLVIFESVLLPTFRDDPLLFLLAALVAFLLFLRRLAWLSWLTNLGMALVVAVGAAVAMVGAVNGTIIPLTVSTASNAGNDILTAIILFIGVSSSLMYFRYAARRTPEGVIQRGQLTQWISVVGKGFIVVTLGAIYATAILTSLTVFTERIGFLASLGGS